jgi:TPR repeat protein
MARWEMGGAELASMAEAKPTPEDLFALGISCSAGREADADLVAAHKWFNIAAVRGYTEAALYRQEIAREMSAGAIAAAQRAAREWLSAH